MGKKLRIAVWYNLPTGGARRALHDHIAGLVAKGHHVECFRPPIPDSKWMPMPCTEHEIPLNIQPEPKTYFQRVLKHVTRMTKGMAAMANHSRQAAAMINPGKFDVLFANTCREYHAPFVGRYTNLPSVLYLQEPNRFLYEALPTLPWVGIPKGSSWRRKLRGVFDRMVVRNQAREELENARSYQKILVNSYYSRESVARAYGLESEVCYLGIDTDLFQPSTQARENFILGIGAIATPKRIELAIQGVGKIPSPRPPLVWVANSVDESYLASLRAIAEEAQVEFDLRVLIPDQELLNLIHRATCVVYTPRLEPFGYVPLEAAACGTPVVTIAEGGLRETMSDGLGWIADPTPEGVAVKLQEILTDPKTAAERTKSQRGSIESKWNLAAATDRLEAHLLQAIENYPPKH